MKKVLFPILALALVLAMASAAIPVQAASEADIQTSIDDGVIWLVAEQYPDGSWYGDPGVTGLAVVKLEDRAFELGFDPFDPAYEYSSNVTAGLDYIFGNAVTDGCGLHIGTWHETYTTGIAMMALAASKDMDRIVSMGNPAVDGMTYGQLLQAFVDYFACAQNPDGGWRYWYLDDPSDQSNTGYAVLGLKYAETAGIAIPQSLKDNLSAWIDLVQDDVNGDINDGGSGYTGWGVNQDDDGDGLIDEDTQDGLDNDGDGLVDEDPGPTWINLLKTGHLLFEMEFVGDTLATQRVQDAIDYIERHWEDANWDPGWKGPSPWGLDQPHMQAAYLLMKGFEAFNIQTIEVGGSAIDWFDEMADAIIDSQIYGGPMGDGYWPEDYWGGAVLATEFALLALERVVPPLDVVIDIKPWSDPNSINLKNKGVIPVAILTTDEFDAAMVDPDTVLFAGAAPVHYAMEDVDNDGDMDMILHFNTQETDIMPGDTEATLTAQTYDGKAFFGTDSVRTIPKSK